MTLKFIFVGRNALLPEFSEQIKTAQQTVSNQLLGPETTLDICSALLLSSIILRERKGKNFHLSSSDLLL